MRIDRPLPRGLPKKYSTEIIACQLFPGDYFAFSGPFFHLRGFSLFPCPPA